MERWKLSVENSHLHAKFSVLALANFLINSLQSAGSDVG